MTPPHRDKLSAGIGEPLVTLIRVAQEDPDIKSLLFEILSLDEFNRESALNTIIEDMKYRSAPKEIVSAMVSLLDNEVANSALKILCKTELMDWKNTKINAITKEKPCP